MSGMFPASPSSPCVQICTLDADGRLCLGCGRSLDEIANWMLMSPSERASVQARLASFRAATLPTTSDGMHEP